MRSLHRYWLGPVIFVAHSMRCRLCVSLNDIWCDSVCRVDVCRQTALRKLRVQPCRMYETEANAQITACTYSNSNALAFTFQSRLRIAIHLIPVLILSSASGASVALPIFVSVLKTGIRSCNVMYLPLCRIQFFFLLYCSCFCVNGVINRTLKEYLKCQKGFCCGFCTNLFKVLFTFCGMLRLNGYFIWQ